MKLHTRNILWAAGLCAGLGLMSNPASAGLVAFYDFEDDVLDSSGNGNHGSVVGTTQFSTSVASEIDARSDKSFDFNGSTHIALTSATNMHSLASSGGATLSVWVQTAGPQNQTYVYSAGNSGNSTVIYGVQGDNADNDHVRTFWRGDNNVSNFSAGIEDVFGVGWHHVLLTDDGDKARVYVDGGLDSTLDYANTTMTTNLSSLGALVRNSTSFELTGQLDEVAIYDSVLSSGDITSLFGGTDPTTIPEPSSLALLGLGGLLIARRRRG